MNELNAILVSSFRYMFSFWMKSKLIGGVWNNIFIAIGSDVRVRTVHGQWLSIGADIS